MRIKKNELNKITKFSEFLTKQEDLLYVDVEDGGVAIFAPKRKIAGSHRCAFLLSIDGEFCFGSIREDCKNFIQPGTTESYYLPKEIKWIEEKLKMAKEYVKYIGGK